MWLDSWNSQLLLCCDAFTSLQMRIDWVVLSVNLHVDVISDRSFDGSFEEIIGTKP